MIAYILIVVAITIIVSFPIWFNETEKIAKLLLCRGLDSHNNIRIIGGFPFSDSYVPQNSCVRCGKKTGEL